MLLSQGPQRGRTGGGRGSAAIARGKARCGRGCFVVVCGCVSLECGHNFVNTGYRTLPYLDIYNYIGTVQYNTYTKVFCTYVPIYLFSRTVI